MAGKQQALLAYVRKSLPIGAVIFLVEDTEFGPVDVLRQLDRWSLQTSPVSVGKEHSGQSFPCLHPSTVQLIGG